MKNVELWRKRKIERGIEKKKNERRKGYGAKNENKDIKERDRKRPINIRYLLQPDTNYKEQVAI